MFASYNQKLEGYNFFPKWKRQITPKQSELTKLMAI